MAESATAQPTLSLVIPAYNEAGRIAGALDQAAAWAHAHPARDLEVVVVDDGSSDGTGDAVDAWLADHPDADRPLAVRVITHETNRGKGAAVRTGMLAATRDTVLMADADMSTAVAEVDKLLPALESGAHVVIGSRDLPGSVLDPPQPSHRRFMGWTFRTLRRAILLPELRDTQCGFKLFQRDAARAIFAHAVDDGWAFDCEALGLARKLGYTIREVPVRWSNRGDSHVSLSAPPRMLLSLLRTRKRLRNGHYDKSTPAASGADLDPASQRR